MWEMEADKDSIPVGFMLDEWLNQVIAAHFEGVCSDIRLSVCKFEKSDIVLISVEHEYIKYIFKNLVMHKFAQSGCKMVANW